MKRIAILIVFLVTTAGAADPELPAGVKSALSVRGVPDDTLSLYVADVDSGATVLEWNSDVPRNPASTIKLLTTLAALDVLGLAYRWRTEVFIDGELKQGKLDGNLIIKGYGDPFLVTERVWQLLRAIRQEES